jgi:hypothetical protein
MKRNIILICVALLCTTTVFGQNDPDLKRNFEVVS